VTTRSRNTTLILFGTLAVLLLLYFILSDDKNHSWDESYNASTEEPYGTFFIKQLLESSHKDGKFIVQKKQRLREILKDEEFKTETSYIFIGESLYLGEDDKKELLDFIDSGNDAFIAIREIPIFLTDLYEHECGQFIILDEDFAESATMNFYHPSLRDKYGYKYTYRFHTEDHKYNWSYFNTSIFCDSTRLLTPLGYIDSNNVNFLRIKYGKGSLYLHCDPLVFTNYFLIKKQKMEYASAVFSHLNGKNIIWDEFGNIPLLGRNGGEASPLYYIMQQPSLKYAWWMIVGSVILYVLFAAKRTQRIIPVLEAKTNTTLEFVKLISALHFQNKNHLDMARKKMKYFNYFIRSKYNIHGHPVTEEMVVKLSEKSKVPLSMVRAIFNMYKLIEDGSGGTIEGPRLSNFYSVIEEFYKQCK
jgi:hypothetical protein